MPVALFGITNDALNMVVGLLILFLVVLYVALIAWTFFDARRRIEDPVLVACATAAALFPFVGPIVYSILRPPEFLADRRERELEIRASELRVRQLEEASCPNCEHPVERTFLRCPNCRARIKDPCESCGKPIDPRWTICPYCEAPTRRGASQERERRAAQKRRGRTRPASEAEPERERATTSASGSRKQAAPARAQRKSAPPPERAPSAAAERVTKSTRTTSSQPKPSAGSGARGSRASSSRTAEQQSARTPKPRPSGSS